MAGPGFATPHFESVIFSGGRMEMRLTFEGQGSWSADVVDGE